MSIKFKSIFHSCRKNWIWHCEWSIGIQTAICLCTQRLFQWRTFLEKYARGTNVSLSALSFSSFFFNSDETQLLVKIYLLLLLLKNAVHLFFFFFFSLSLHCARIWFDFIYYFYLNSTIKVGLKWLGGIYSLVIGNLTFYVQLVWNHAMKEASTVARYSLFVWNFAVG